MNPAPPVTTTLTSARIPVRREWLAARAVPRATAGRARLPDLAAAPVAGLAFAAVDTQRRPLAGDPRLERLADGLVESLQLVLVQVAGGTEGMDLRSPKRLVRIDVSHAGGGALVEEGGLDRGAPSIEACSQARRREGSGQRFFPEALGEVRNVFARLEQEPRAEPPDIPINDVRSVV